MKNQLLQKFSYGMTLAAGLLIWLAAPCAASAANTLTLTITSPTANKLLSNAVLNVTGTASGTVPVEEVFYKLNNGTWLPAIGTNNWTVGVTLTPGTNVIQAYAVDTTGTVLSPTKSVTVFYVVTTALEVNVTGLGTLSPNLSGQLLEIGKSYTMKATPSAGFAFTNWSGDISSTNPSLTFLMADGLELNANFVDVTKPTVVITAPKAGQNVSNASFTITGTAKDNVGVGSVFYQLNSGGWNPAQTANDWTNWTAGVTLIPGTNTVQAYAVDAAGNVSTTVSASFVYVLSAVLTVNTNGNGTVTPNDNGALLQIGKTFTLKATASTGFSFTGWTGSQTTNNATLSFVMASNLTFTANFVDIAAPTLAITAPKANLNVSNSVFTVTGTAKDNVGVNSVFYQVNGGSWLAAFSSNSWTNWSATANLTPGTNTVKAYASDAAGNNSTTQSVSFVYVLSAVLTVNTNGNGTVTPNDNGALLQIGKTFTLKATASTGFKFVNWTGSQTTTNPSLTFTMASNLTFTANFMDDTAPTLVITAPKTGQNVSNAAFTVTGTAKDNVGVSSVFYQLNGGSWLLATTANAFTNWSVGVMLTPGTNTIKAYALDAQDNMSVTETASVVYVLSAVLTVNTNGNGTISPNLNGQLLQIGKTFTMKATAASGFAFTNWTGSQTTNNATLTFTMDSNLTFTANFVDVAKPTVKITSPTPGLHVSNANYIVMGTAADNVEVASVFYNLNAGGWNPAQTFNGWSNWMVSVTLTPGTNNVQAYSVDSTGNVSPTTNVTFVYVTPPDWAPDSLAGLVADVTPEGQIPLSVGFGVDTFSQFSTDTNNTSGVGNYTYTKVGTNTALLTLVNTLPPASVGGTNFINLTFNAVDSGVFTNQDGGGDSGTLVLAPSANLPPASLSGRKITAGTTTVTFSSSTFNQTDSGGGTAKAGNYVYQAYSPVGAFVTLNYTSPSNRAGFVSFVFVSFSSSTAGTVSVNSYDNLNNLTSTDFSNFTLH